MVDTGAAATPSNENAAPTTIPSISTPAAQSKSLEARGANTQPALATSKRKFHQILENLTKPSPSSAKRPHDTLSSSTDSPAKRIRREARARLEANTVPSRTGIPSAHIQSQLLKSRLDAAKAASVRNRPTDVPRPATPDSFPSLEPNYVPWSHDAFLRRLRTFANVSLWSSKPDPVNEVAWARRGWVCVGFNTVACKGGCEQRVVVGLRPKRQDAQGNEIENTEDFSAEVDDELVNRVADLVVSAHEDGCLWKGAGCRDDVYRLPIARPVVWQPQLRDRYRSFTALASAIPPSTNIVSPIDTATMASLLPPDLLSEQEPSTDAVVHDVNHTALGLALFGWSAKLQSPGYALATCSSCFRRLGLWLYNRRTDDNGVEPTKLDLVNNHRDYCPWVNAKSQAMPGFMSDMPAWQVLKKCIENDAGFRGWSKSSATTSKIDSRTATNEENQTQRSDDVQASPALSSRSKEDIEKEDQARFAKLRELSKAIGLKRLGLKEKFGRLKPAVEPRPTVSNGIADQNN